jgi:hypothetical protein
VNLGPLGNPDHDRPYNFGRARSVGGLAIIVLVGVLAVIDAASESYSIDTIQLGLLLGTGLLLLGIEAGRKLLGGGG